MLVSMSAVLLLGLLLWFLIRIRYLRWLEFLLSAAFGFLVAKTAAAPIVHEIVTALGDRSPARLTLLAGHDTNVADLGGFFDLHWQVPGFAADEPLETLGERLALPPFLEPRRAEIEAGLKPLRR